MMKHAPEWGRTSTLQLDFKVRRFIFMSNILVYYMYIICIMNLLTRERFPKGFLSTASVAKWIGHWRQVQEVVVSNLALGKLI